MGYTSSGTDIHRMYVAAVNIDIRRLLFDLKRDSCAVCRSEAIAAVLSPVETLLADRLPGAARLCACT